VSSGFAARRSPSETARPFRADAVARPRALVAAAGGRSVGSFVSRARRTRRRRRGEPVGPDRVPEGRLRKRHRRRYGISGSDREGQRRGARPADLRQRRRRMAPRICGNRRGHRRPGPAGLSHAEVLRRRGVPRAAARPRVARGRVARRGVGRSRRRRRRARHRDEIRRRRPPGGNPRRHRRAASSSGDRTTRRSRASV
jgi:hypothetical protein